jgi:ketosteroid isomerase-like protein
MAEASSTGAAHWDAVTTATLATVQRFNDATNRHDVDAMMALMTDDVIFENTVPPPDGERRVGQAAVRAAWEELFRASPRAVFETEELFAAGDRCVVRWLYRWAPDEAGKPGHVRGVDIFRVRDGKVAEKLSYVKG